ncbi:HAD-IIIA family hydrolase [Virgibacillus halophilus]|uniref:HAD-IIIA family hydrolase n=1 Tax=Tigheibacillus halophilus TaxID=361280 RepID=UPI003629592F
MIEAVFVDRDGTIGGGKGVLYPDEFRLFSYVKQTIQRIKEAGITVCSFTNQPGISKGEVKKEQYNEELCRFGFDKVYLCPHTNEEGCQCRKPGTGMLLQAAEENNFSLKRCVVVGDRWTDMLAAQRAGCRKILIQTGAGREALTGYLQREYVGEWAAVTLDHIASNFKEAAAWLLDRQKMEDGT